MSKHNLNHKTSTRDTFLLCLLKNAVLVHFKAMSESPGTPDTPGRKAVNVMESIRKDIVFKTPVGVPKRRSKQKVLEEEIYIEVS